MRCRVLALLFVTILVLTTAAAAQKENQPRGSSSSESRAFAHEILSQQEAEQSRALAEEILSKREEMAGRSFDARWRQQQLTKFSMLDVERLHEIRAALDEGIVLPAGADKDLGDHDKDLVFTPLSSACRAVDTRSDDASGSLTQDTAYSFYVSGSWLTNQGSSFNCGLPFGPAVAITANILAVDPAGKGNMQVWDFSNGSGGPKGDSYINFAAASVSQMNLINGIMIPICNPAVSGCGGGDLYVEPNFTDTDMVFNVTGWFSAPEATALDCTTILTEENHTGTFTMTASCSSGYTRTGCGHNWYEGSTDVWFWEVGPPVEDSTANACECRGIVDRAGESSEISCFATCCRVPGIV